MSGFSGSSKKLKPWERTGAAPQGVAPTAESRRFGKPTMIERAKRRTAMRKQSLYTPDSDDSYKNRILSCLAISPAKSVLSDFGDAREVLGALRDATGPTSLFTSKGGYSTVTFQRITSSSQIVQNQVVFEGYLSIWTWQRS